MIFTKEKAGGWFTFSTIVCFSLWFYHNTIHLPPSHIHAWTQSDRLALVLGYLDNGMNFFTPQLFNLNSENGITGVDLPIHEYIVAWMMKMLGTESPAIFRIYNWLWSVVGAWFLFRLMRLYSSSSFKSGLVALFAYTLPIMVYYQAGFIPSTSAFAASCIAYYYYFRYEKIIKIRDFYLAIAFVALAAVTRMPFHIFLFAMLLQRIVFWIQHKKVIRKELVAFALAYVCIFLWLWYKAYLNQKYGSQFLTSLMPPSSWGDFKEILKKVIATWKFQLFTIYHYILLAIAIISVIVHFIEKRKETLQHPFTLQIALLIAGFCVYFVLLAEQFKAHEYYFIDSFYLGVILLFALGVIWIPFSKKIVRIGCVVVGAGLLLGATWESKKVQELKYSDAAWDLMEVTRKNYTGAKEYLDSLGIPRDAKILVIDAYSTNTPLMLMRRKGYTVLSTTWENIHEAMSLDFDYIVNQDIYFPSEVIFNYPEFLNIMERIDGNGTLSVFKRKDKPHPSSLYEMMGITHISETYTWDFEQAKDSLGLWSNTHDRSTERSISVSHSQKLNSEYGLTLALDVNDEKIENLLFEGHFYTDTPRAKFRVVVSIEKDGKSLFYNDIPYFRMDKASEWLKYQRLVPLPKLSGENVKLKCYIWNQSREQLYIDDVKVSLY